MGLFFTDRILRMWESYHLQTEEATRERLMMRTAHDRLEVIGNEMELFLGKARDRSVPATPWEQIFPPAQPPSSSPPPGSRAPTTPIGESATPGLLQTNAPPPSPVEETTTNGGPALPGMEDGDPVNRDAVPASGGAVPANEEPRPATQSSTPANGVIPAQVPTVARLPPAAPRASSLGLPPVPTRQDSAGRKRSLSAIPEDLEPSRSKRSRTE
ncbi:hypothetical protein M413DRAFT_153113 [Hebeloma cylindrosporum]|uniref:Uncharacterized protein n=1 Tax=Hebeloma cylindrosporum TaxID=76867 RepID=A0A0C3BRG1_HEBCY|nr:hypothetical protein M413DRAFT_153113 [Hebeloma cylindrosporum h7]